MKKLLLLIIITIFVSPIVKAQDGYKCATAFDLPDLTDTYCSAIGQYNNSNIVQAGITWFKFTAARTSLTVIVSGASIGGTLQTPSIKLYTDCNTQFIGALSSNNANITTLHAEQLTTGKTYYLAVSGQNLGSFKLCVNNYYTDPADGEDCATALYLENTNDIHVGAFMGVGNVPRETAGTCLNGDESNTTWYKWKAANDKKLVFTITPDQQDNDIDFVLYDLGTTGDCSGVTAINAIRCAAGHGIGCNPAYYKTGLDFNATDVSEVSGCSTADDGVIRYVDQIPGHIYGLIVSNFSSSQGFTLTFADRNGQPGTATFDLPDALISANLTSCTSKSYTFNSYSTQNNIFKWDFGPGSTIVDAGADGSFIVSFNSSGTKTIKLTIYNTLGQSHTTTTTIDVPNLIVPDQPNIVADKPVYCPGDVMHLSTTVVTGLTYQWTGPDNFTASTPAIDIPITNTYVAGTYYLSTSNTQCQSTASTYTPIVGVNPVAAFTSAPSTPITLIIPAVISFINQSTSASSYLWDFGDGSTSTDINPQHTYTTNGTFHVKLTAINPTTCAVSVTEGDYIIKFGNVIFIPNTFTPNADGINDKFGVSITNLKTYHIQIFNRYGGLVFESRDASNLWDGHQKGNDLPVGTYYYVINALGLDDNDIKQAGWVSLIR